MSRKKIFAVFLPFAGLFLILAFAYGLTKLNQALQAGDPITFQLYLVLPWSYALTTFLATGAAMVLFWVIFTRAPYSKWTGWIFLIVGLALTLVPFIPFIFYVLFRIQSINWGFLPAMLTDPAPDSPIYITEMEIAMIGLFLLILPRSQSLEREKPEIQSQPPVL